MKHLQPRECLDDIHSRELRLALACETLGRPVGKANDHKAADNTSHMPRQALHCGAGVVGIYGPGSNIVECAADVLRLLGHNMPPEGLSEAGQ